MTPRETRFGASRIGQCLLSLTFAACLIAVSVLIMVPSPAYALDDRRTASASARKPAKSWFQRYFGRVTWEEARAQCASPMDVCHAVERGVGYKTEEIDRWAPPRETWTTGRGDCEDFATCVEAFCHELGFEATVRLYFPSDERGDGHAVVTGTWNGRMWMSSIGSYEEVKSLDEVEEAVARVLHCSKDRMWNTCLQHDDLSRFIDHEHELSVAYR